MLGMLLTMLTYCDAQCFAVLDADAVRTIDADVNLESHSRSLSLRQQAASME